jgi:hypothetical protein
LKSSSAAISNTKSEDVLKLEERKWWWLFFNNWSFIYIELFFNW